MLTQPKLFKCLSYLKRSFMCGYGKRYSASRAAKWKKNLYNFQGIPKDYYEILGVSEDASTVEIRQAYHSLNKLLHPDTKLSSQTSKKITMRTTFEAQAASRKLSEAQEAYYVLKNENRRQEYDEEIRMYNYEKHQDMDEAAREADRWEYSTGKNTQFRTDYSRYTRELGNLSETTRRHEVKKFWNKKLQEEMEIQIKETEDEKQRRANTLDYKKWKAKLDAKRGNMHSVNETISLNEFSGVTRDYGIYNMNKDKVNKNFSERHEKFKLFTKGNTNNNNKDFNFSYSGAADKNEKISMDRFTEDELFSLKNSNNNDNNKHAGNFDEYEESAYKTTYTSKYIYEDMKKKLEEEIENNNNGFYSWTGPLDNKKLKYNRKKKSDIDFEIKNKPKDGFGVNHTRNSILNVRKWNNDRNETMLLTDGKKQLRNNYFRILYDNSSSNNSNNNNTIYSITKSNMKSNESFEKPRINKAFSNNKQSNAPQLFNVKYNTTSDTDGRKLGYKIINGHIIGVGFVLLFIYNIKNKKNDFYI